MKTIQVNFPSATGVKLMGRLELPTDQHPHNYALFAHCFTCNKNLLAVKNISRSLTSQGFAVLRFDFTGLGESEGDFADTNFSANVEDLIAAANYLRDHYRAPSLLIGHSLGGAAVVFAAHQLESVRALATIGAPADPEHVTHLLRNSIEEIREQGEALVHLSGREFRIRKQFLDDLQNHSLRETAGMLRKPILILHSPQDDTVGIKNAEILYTSAHHPKSFVSLDGADHLLARKEDSLYAGKVIAGWADRYLPAPEPVHQGLRTREQVVGSLDAEDGFSTAMKVGRHYLMADEPEEFGGHDFGPSPYEWISAGLTACTVMTLQLYAKRKGWPLENVEVHASHNKIHAHDCEQSEKDGSKIDRFELRIRLEGNLSDQQVSRLLDIAHRCPVHKTLAAPAEIKIGLL